MEILNKVELSLTQNNLLTENVKENILELIQIFNSKFPSVELDNLAEKLKTLNIVRTSKFLNKDISMYDCKTNTIRLNLSEMDKAYDMRHVLMFELLNVITSNNYHTGFNNDNSLEALNMGYTEILANYLVGNSGEIPIYPNEAVSANLISIIINDDTLFEAYFKNNSQIIYNKLVEKGIRL